MENRKLFSSNTYLGVDLIVKQYKSVLEGLIKIFMRGLTIPNILKSIVDKDIYKRIICYLD